ncbi:conserved hypothetical protein [uncultured Defluviicoccus sp.]|uniref:FAD-binding PCMH-type domain-containing protein n=1 Tax=metagenome TaxID=256318 RepID=A0A380TFW7_9ZZZZ|nr:conserved hypothetical protein [uncultured Defluviicoccus sp.]
MTSKLSSKMLEALHTAVPAERISTEAADRAKHVKDYWPAIAKWSEARIEAAAPVAVVRPRTVAEVSAVLRVANQGLFGVVPYAGASGVCGGVVPEGPAISLDLRELTGIAHFNPTDCMVTAYAGTPAAELEKFLNEKGFTTGHYPQSLPLASIGGLVATRSSGTFSSKYGNIEDMVIALEVVLADGRVIANKATPRAATGPRLSDLYIGSEGALGVITQVTLRIRPLPEARCFRGIAFADLKEGLAATREFFTKDIVPAVIRLYNAAESEHLFERVGQAPAGRSLLILGFDGNRAVVEVVERLVLETCQRHGGQDLGREIGEGWERGRFDAFWLEKGNAGLKVADAIEVSGAWSVLPEMYDRVTAALKPQVDQLWSHFSHCYGQGSSIYFIVFASDQSREAVLAKYHLIWKTVMTEVLAVGGAISHHHGIGMIRAPYIAEEAGSSFELLKAIKDAVDPTGILNPGKLGLKRT